MNVKNSLGHSGLHQMILILLTIMLLTLVAFALRSGLSYVIQYRANATIDRWYQSSVNQVQLQQWNELKGSVESMLVVDANNAELHQVLGRLYFYRAVRIDITANPNHYQADLVQAMDSSRASIELRPAWALAYMDLLAAKLSAGIFDAEMNDMLRRLVQLAPWEKSMLSDIIYTSAYAWKSLDPQSKDILKPYILLAAQQRKGEVTLALKKLVQKKVFCQEVFDVQKNEACFE